MAANVRRSGLRPTERFVVDPTRPDWRAIRRVARGVREGDVALIPTDTVYGLAADPLNPRAVAAVFRMKRRAENQPILLLIDSPRDADQFISERPAAFDRLAADFWPGPLTLIVPASPRAPREITAGTGKVALRSPSSLVARRLAREVGGPVTGTSANLSGRPPAVDVREAALQLGAAVAYIVDGGRARSRTPSTIVDLTGERPRVAREGALSVARLRPYIG